MKPTILPLAMFMLFTSSMLAQSSSGKENTSTETPLLRYDLRTGVALSLLGTGDYLMQTLENELNVKLNRFFTTSASFALARNVGGLPGASFVQGNLNVYLSPFRNDRGNDFRLGTGLTLYHVSDNSVFVNPKEHQRNSIGFNIIIEDTQTIADKYLIGFKLFTQSYSNSDINSGIMLKVGIKL